MKTSIYEKVTNRMIELLEAGTSPWQRDWKLNNAGYGMPHNACTGYAYRGINLMLLMCEQVEKGYTSTGWITKGALFKLGRENKGELDWQGQKFTEVVLWKPTKRTDKATGEKVDSVYATSFLVMNLDQIKGIDKFADQLKGFKALLSPEEIEEPHEIMEAVRAGLDIKLNHGGDRAFYSPSQDFVQMPPRKSFKTEEGYIGTGMHEFVHATGHKSRCDRGVKAMQGRFGTEAYAFEELVAELGACFLQESLGIEMHTENHASYLASWLKVLKDDKKAIFTAASKAQKAADYILDAAGIKAAPKATEEQTKEAA